MEAGLGIIQVGYAGLSGTLEILDKYREEILKRTNEDFIASLEEDRKSFYYIENNKISSDLLDEEISLEFTSEDFFIRRLGSLGVFGALYQFAKDNSVGIEIYGMDIPVIQETIEICDMYDLNPYKLYSKGSFLIICKEALKIQNDLSNLGVVSGIIGVTIDTQDKILHGKDHVGKLMKTKVDEIQKIREDKE
ncbi:MAG: hypothetical protein LBM02_09400 [Lachnospiraceae bacterium]|jgi:hydrogenase maturation factor|nr:hypothetical protein [Lachnospiraceae bacterium]